jgi:hypothetical protein
MKEGICAREREIRITHCANVWPSSENERSAAPGKQALRLGMSVGANCPEAYRSRIAMLQASEEVKKAATYTTKSSEEEGFAHAVQHYVLSNHRDLSGNASQ